MKPFKMLTITRCSTQLHQALMQLIHTKQITDLATILMSPISYFLGKAACKSVTVGGGLINVSWSQPFSPYETGYMVFNATASIEP